MDDFREAYYWLRQNTDEHARVMSWWDYGYQIAGMANRTTLVDNNTWNNSHIALVCSGNYLFWELGVRAFFLVFIIKHFKMSLLVKTSFVDC